MPKTIATQGLQSILDINIYNAFQTRLQNLAATDISQQIASVFSVEKMSQVSIPFLWFPPRMREWVGERRRTGLDGATHTIDVKTYESTLAIPRQMVEDDMTDLITQRVANAANEYMRFLHEQVVNVLLNGTAINSFDGEPLLSTTGGTRGANNANLLTSAPLSHENIQDAISRMMLFEEPFEGRPMGVMATHLLVGPKLKWLAAQILESTTLIGNPTNPVGSRNVLQGVLELVVSPYIPDNRWFVIASGDMNDWRPVIRIDRADVPVEFSARTTPDSESVFHRDSYEYGIRARHGFGAGAWYAVVGGQP